MFSRWLIVRTSSSHGRVLTAVLFLDALAESILDSCLRGSAVQWVSHGLSYSLSRHDLSDMVWAMGEIVTGSSEWRLWKTHGKLKQVCTQTTKQWISLLQTNRKKSKFSSCCYLCFEKKRVELKKIPLVSETVASTQRCRETDVAAQCVCSPISYHMCFAQSWAYTGKYFTLGFCVT